MKRLLFVFLLSPLVFSNEMPIQSSEDSTNKNDLILRGILIEKRSTYIDCDETAYEYISMIKQELDKGLNFQKASHCYSYLHGHHANLGYYDPDDYPEYLTSELNGLNANQASGIIDLVEDELYAIFTLSTEEDIPYSKSNCPLIRYKNVCPYKPPENEICGSALNGLRYQEEFLKKFPKSDKRALRSARKNYEDCVKIYLGVPD